jgi:response regulator RpfG family c-di-GMP phosphodiesterase
LQPQQAVSVIKSGKETHFDPLVVEAFVMIQEQFLAIAFQFLDSRSTLILSFS